MAYCHFDLAIFFFASLSLIFRGYEAGLACFQCHALNLVYSGPLSTLCAIRGPTAPQAKAFLAYFLRSLSIAWRILTLT